MKQCPIKSTIFFPIGTWQSNKSVSATSAQSLAYGFVFGAAAENQTGGHESWRC